MIDIVMILYLLFFCAVSAVTDWKKGKIYNKWLTIGMCPGVILVICYYIGHSESLLLFFTNLAAAVVIAVMFYSLKLWGAGDSKLWMFVNFLYPAGWYATTSNMLFPSMLLFMVIFIEAYLYLIGESVWYYLFKKEKGVTLKHEKIGWMQVWNLAFSISFLSIVYTVCSVLFKNYYESNRIFFSVVGILLTNKLVSIKFPGKKVWTIVLTGMYIALNLGFYGGFDKKMLVLTILLVVITHFSLQFADQYNYEWIPTKEVKEGMIMSYFAIQQFFGSRVKGLPDTTDETTKSRISADEADAIKRWEKSKYGQPQIMVVRYIPFAVFILIGMITYIIGVYNLR